MLLMMMMMMMIMIHYMNNDNTISNNNNNNPTVSTLLTLFETREASLVLHVWNHSSQKDFGCCVYSPEAGRNLLL